MVRQLTLDCQTFKCLVGILVVRPALTARQSRQSRVYSALYTVLTVCTAVRAAAAARRRQRPSHHPHCTGPVLHPRTVTTAQHWPPTHYTTIQVSSVDSSGSSISSSSGSGGSGGGGVERGAAGGGPGGRRGCFSGARHCTPLSPGKDRLGGLSECWAGGGGRAHVVRECTAIIRVVRVTV